MALGAVVAFRALDSALGLHTKILGMALSFAGFFRTRSAAACALYMLVYVVVSLICMPLTPFEIFTGFCFGVPLGIGLDICGRVLGAVISFLIGRAILRGGTDCSCLTGAAVLRGVGKAVEEQGLRFLILFNLAYVPVAIKNYGLGFIPEVPLYLFVAAIICVEVPMASIWASIGSAAAADLAAAGLLDTNATAVRIAVAGGPSKEGLPLQIGLLVLGAGSIPAVLCIVQRRVSEQMRLATDGALGTREGGGRALLREAGEAEEA